MNTILESRIYTRDELKNAAVILHPRSIEKYWIWPQDVGVICEQGSNFTRLKNPITDSTWSQYWDSEAYYMALRFKDPTIRKMIALCSTEKHFSKQAAYILKDQMEQDAEKRVDYMRKALREKFLNNPHLAQKLKKTWTRDIIEFTYWWDTFFGIAHDTMTGSNILGKLLVETRELISKQV